MAFTTLRAESARANPIDMLARIPRSAVHEIIEMLLERLDFEDGDPEAEETDLEDSFVLSWYAQGDGGAGCAISDAGGGNVEDEGEDAERSEV
jgi:hypothetical protein